MLRKFLAIGIESEEAETGCLLAVQATFFECGGMAIGLAMSHKLIDAASLRKFLDTWAATSSGYKQVLAPEFGAASILPPLEILKAQVLAPIESVKKKEKNKSVTRRYVFGAAEIEALRFKAASESVQNPTRVEAVSALLWKSALQASRSNAAGVSVSGPSVLCQRG